VGGPIPQESHAELSSRRPTITVADPYETFDSELRAVPPALQIENCNGVTLPDFAFGKSVPRLPPTDVGHPLL